jgi:ATP/ADP translocase
MKLDLPFIGSIKMTEYARILLAIIIFLIVLEVIINVLKKRWKKQYLSPEVNPTKSKNNENYLIYYRKNQVLSTIHVLIIVVAAAILLTEGTQNIWSFFAIGI